MKIFFRKIQNSDIFWHRKVTLKVRNWHFLSADFGVLVGLMMTWFSEEMLISNICIRGLMCSAIKKSWKVSNINSLKILFRQIFKLEKVLINAELCMTSLTNYSNSAWTLHSIVRKFEKKKNLQSWSSQNVLLLCLLYNNSVCLVWQKKYLWINKRVQEFVESKLRYFSNLSCRFLNPNIFKSN